MPLSGAFGWLPADPHGLHRGLRLRRACSPEKTLQTRTLQTRNLQTRNLQTRNLQPPNPQTYTLMANLFGLKARCNRSPRAHARGKIITLPQGGLNARSNQ